MSVIFNRPFEVCLPSKLLCIVSNGFFASQAFMYSIERLLRRCCSYQWNVQNIVHLFLQVNPPMCVCFPNSLYPSPFVCLTMILCWTEKSSKSSFFFKHACDVRSNHLHHSSPGHFLTNRPTSGSHSSNAFLPSRETRHEHRQKVTKSINVYYIGSTSKFFSRTPSFLPT
jgi:hypothetical protein